MQKSEVTHFFENFVSAVLVSCGCLFAQTTCLIDFGNDAAKTMGVDSYGRAWNNVHQYNSAGIGNLISIDSRKTGVRLDMFAPKGRIIFNASGEPTPSLTGPSDLNVISAARDWLLLNDQNDAQLSLGNLPAQAVLRLTFYGGFPSDQIRITRFDVTGGTSSTVYLQTSGTGIDPREPFNANQSQVAIVDNITPTAEGKVNILVRKHLGDAGHLGILKVEIKNQVDFKPAADDVAVAGSRKSGNALVGRYTYFDREGDAEAATELIWEKCFQPASAASPITVVSHGTTILTPTDQDIGAHFRFSVRPRAKSGSVVGDTRMSAWIGPVVSSTIISSFHVGSSFTQWPNIPRQFQNLCIAASMPASSQWQVTSGRNLLYHWENGLDGIIGAGSYSRHEIATGSYDVVVIQPFNDEWQSANINRAIDYCGRFYQLANDANSQVYLFQGWPWLSQTISTQNSINAAFEQIRSAISLNSAKPALVVPAGEVVRAIIEDAQTGVLKDYNTNNALSRSNFYIDNLHLGNLGAYAVALTHYATITKRSPVGLPNTAFDANFYNDNVVSFNPAVVARIQQIVWDVVSSYPNALAVNSSQAIPPWEPVIVVPPVTPPPPVEPDPPFVTESATPSDAVLLTFAFGSGSQGSPAVLSNLPKPVAAGAPEQFAMEYTINPVAETEGVVYTPHWSYDLKNWTITQPANTVISRTDNTVRIAWPNTSRWRFLRIHLAKPAQ